MIRQYIGRQENEDRRLGRMKMFAWSRRRLQNNPL